MISFWGELPDTWTTRLYWSCPWAELFQWKGENVTFFHVLQKISTYWLVLWYKVVINARYQIPVLYLLFNEGCYVKSVHELSSEIVHFPLAAQMCKSSYGTRYTK